MFVCKLILMDRRTLPMSNGVSPPNPPDTLTVATSTFLHSVFLPSSAVYCSCLGAASFFPPDRKQFVTRKTNSSCTHKHFLATWTLRQNAKELEECDPVTLACRLPHGDRTLGCIGRGGQNSSGVWPCLWTATRMTRPCSIFAQVMEVNACESSV